MKSRYILALVGAVALATPLAAQPVVSAGPVVGSTTLNFNLLTAGTVLSNQFPGVTISNGLCANSDYSSSLFNNDPMQVSNFTDYTSGACNGLQGQGFTFTFARAINSFGFLGVTNGYGINFTTGNGSVTAPYTFPPTAIYYGFTDVTPFSSVQVNVLGDGYVVLDDVSYATTVPEPSSVALVAAGLLGALGVNRRRKQRNA